MKITRYAVYRRLATSAIALALVALGLYGLWRLPVDFLPDITHPLIRVHIWWRGATPEEIEKNIAEPVERQIASVDDVDYLESSSIEGMYTLEVNFRYGTNVDVAYQDALAAMARVARGLPKDIDPPIVLKADPSQLPVLQLTVSSDQWDLVQLREWTDNWLKYQIAAVPGVAGTEIVGGLKREIRVLLNPAAMEKHKLSLETVIRRLAEENVEQFGGRVTVGPREIIARTIGEYRSLEDIRSLVIARNNETKVYLRDIAQIVDGHEEVRVITRLDGKPCVKLSVLKQATANTVEVARQVDQKLAELKSALPPGVRLGMLENQGVYVKSALAGVRNAAVEAAILLIVIVYLFLGSFRQVLVMIIALPLALVLNFGLMKLAGFSLNIFSLGGLVIAMGVVLDNSLVVLENITRLRRQSPQEEAGDQIVAATTEVGPAIVAATFSFLALFLPFLIVPGLTSLLFRELILVITGIVVISLFTAISVTPMMSALIFRKRHSSRNATRFERFFEGVTEGYGRLLERGLRWRWLVLTAFAGLLLLGIGVLPKLGGEFLPRMDDGQIMIKVKLPTGAALAETEKVLHEIERKIGNDETIESVFTLAGGKVKGLYTYEIANEGELNIQLVPRSKRGLSTQGAIARLRPLVAGVSVAGGRAMVSQKPIKGMRMSGSSDIEVKIRGEDMATLFELARQAAGAMNELEHLTNVQVSLDMTKPEYQVRVDRVRAAELGVSVRAAADTLRSLITGAVATRYRENGEYYNVRVMIPADRMISRTDVENLAMSCAQGDLLRLQDVATVMAAAGPVEIVREDQVKQVVVQGDAAGVNVAAALNEIKAALAGLETPAGYEFSFGGQASMMADMKRNVLTVLLFAVFFSFIVLTVQFESLRLPALILASVPVCLAGMVFLLHLTGFPLGATVIIGVLVVVAATVNDGVLLLTFAHELQNRTGLSATRAVFDAAKIRLRPRVMTTVTTMVGFLPLALNLEEGGDMLQPMAVAAIGGLGLEILVALFLMPCLYVILAKQTQ